MGVGNWEAVSGGVGRDWEEMGSLSEIGRGISGSRPTALGLDRAET